MNAPSLSCEESRQSLIAYAGGDLPEPLHAAMEQHLTVCATCRNEVAALRDLLAAVEHLPDPPLPEQFWHEFRATVHGRVAAAPAPYEPMSRRMLGRLDSLSVLRPVPVVGAALALGLLLAIGLLQSPRPRDPVGFELLALGESLPIAQNLDLLEQMDVLENLDLLEHLSDVRAPEIPQRTGRS